MALTQVALVNITVPFRPALTYQDILLSICKAWHLFRPARQCAARDRGGDESQFCSETSTAMVSGASARNRCGSSAG